MIDRKLHVYRWFRCGVLCSLFGRNIPSSTVSGVCYKGCYIALFLVCTCNLYCVMPTKYNIIWNVHAKKSHCNYYYLDKPIVNKIND